MTRLDPERIQMAFIFYRMNGKQEGLTTNGVQ